MPRLETRLRDLGDAGSTWKMAHVCAAVLLKELRATTVLVHVRCRAHDELRTIGAAGKHAADYLGAAFWVKDDAFARSVIESAAPVRARFDAVPARLAVLAPSRSILAVAVRLRGSCVGVLEALDPDAGYDAVASLAISLVAERLASALGSKDKGGQL